MSSTTLVLVIIVIIVVVAALAVAGYQLARRKRTERLQAQYGPEYDRVVSGSDDPREAEAELRDRSKRHEELDLRRLSRAEREGFDGRWTKIQAQFVDDPSAAVRAADQLVVDVMSARGYPVDDFEQRADDLSVSHPEVTQRYREARRIADANQKGSADTDDLRRAVTSYRALVRALLSDDGAAGSGDRARDQRNPTSSGTDRDKGHSRDMGAPAPRSSRQSDRTQKRDTERKAR